MWDLVRIEARSSHRFLLTACAGAGLVIGLEAIGLFLITTAEPPTDTVGVGDAVAVGIFGAMAVAGSAVALWMLSLIEATGIRMFAKRHGWRTTREVAATVVAHAAPLWLAGAPLGLAGLATCLLARPVPWTGFGAAEVGALLWFAQFPVGLLAFEAVVYIGWRRLRFANRPRRRSADAPDGA